MISALPVPRVLAAASSLGGLTFMMLQPGPSVTGVLSGLASILLCLVFSAVPKPRLHNRRRQAIAQTITRSAPRTEPPPHPISQPLKKPELMPSMLPEFPSHRERVKERRATRRR
jgi:hypothetical protein